MKIAGQKVIQNMVAVTFVIATILLSCKEDIPRSDMQAMEGMPTQKIENMRVVQFSKGIASFIVEAPLMERYTEVEIPYDVFPQGVKMRGFTPEGVLETLIVADYAKHVIKEAEEIWEAHGNVVINNYIKGEKMETDTLYWNKLNKRIYTHTWVKLTTPDLFMQGYGMESDEMARNAVIKQPFDSYAIVNRDSTEIAYVDTVNFIGPIIKRVR